LELWELRNKEVHGETPEKIEIIRRQSMIDEIKHIQMAHAHLSASARALIRRDVISLRAMTTSSITAYLYGAKELVEEYRQNTINVETGQQRIQQFFQPR
jgi:hypothetical protein